MSQVTITLLFLLFAIVMFMWEKIPLGLTSMIVCVGLVVWEFWTGRQHFQDSLTATSSCLLRCSL